MKILISGYPYFAQKIAHDLMEQDSANNTFTYLCPIDGLLSKIRSIYSIITYDVLYIIGGTLKKNKIIDLALFLNKKVIMHWVGSDVLDSFKDHHNSNTNLSYYRRITHFCEVDWIQNELTDIDVYAEIVSIASIDISTNITFNLPQMFSILSYIGAGKEDFYGINNLVKLAQDFPTITINIVGICKFKNVDLPNIKFLGWVDDMSYYYKSSVLYLRLPKHDGLAFSVIEALSYGRYVGYSYKLDNTYYIDNYDKLKLVVSELFDKFTSNSLNDNSEGVYFVTKYYNKNTVLDRLIYLLCH